jgi:excisionase family DNA binding protein
MIAIRARSSLTLRQTHLPLFLHAPGIKLAVRHFSPGSGICTNEGQSPDNETTAKRILLWVSKGHDMRDDFRESSKRLDVEALAGGNQTYHSVAALAQDIGLSERSTRSALRRGEIPHIRVGRRFILPRAAIAAWLRSAGRSHQAEQTAEHRGDHAKLIASDSHSEVTVMRPSKLAEG